MRRKVLRNFMNLSKLKWK